MTSRPCILSQLLLCTVLLTAGTGCAELGSRRISVHRAFIVHWPPPKGAQELRLAVKDIIDMKGIVTTVGSAHFASVHQPAARDAKCLEGARRRGVRIVGKTNLTEFALGTSGLNEFFGTPKNNLNEEDRLIPGGSSSGSAVAVASGFADVAFGTDTGGSIRTPAACCGIFGLKTTYGLVPLHGVAPLSPRYLDTVGPMAKDLDHLVTGMDLLKPGFAAQYHRATAAKPSARQIRIGRVKIAGTDPAVDAAVDAALAAKGFRVVQLPEAFSKKWSEAQKHGRTIAMADAWLNYGDHSNEKGVARATKTILMLGEVEYRTRYDDALKGRVEWQRTLRDIFRRVDFLAVPTMQKLPPKIPLFGRTALLEALVFDMQNTAAVNLAGNPAVAIPIPVEAEDATVTSLQLVGPPLSEAPLLNAARIIETPRP